jgi:hypothetical protein
MEQRHAAYLAAAPGQALGLAMHATASLAVQKSVSPPRQLKPDSQDRMVA